MMMELISCAEREAKRRRQVYQKYVAEGLMSRAYADEEIERMAAIGSFLRKHASGE
jgi:hypothetical protein